MDMGKTKYFWHGKGTEDQGEVLLVAGCWCGGLDARLWEHLSRVTLTTEGSHPLKSLRHKILLFQPRQSNEICDAKQC